MKRTCMLFVGSDELLGAVMVATLEDIGYEARAETEPRKVLRDFAKEPGSLDGVILECAMPDLDGPELAKWLSVIRPDLPMILLTGYPETGSEKRTGEAGFRAVLSKPVTRPALLQALGRLFPVPAEFTLNYASL